MTPPSWQKVKRNKEPRDESESGEWKSCLKLNIQKTKITASGPITSWQIDGEKWKQWQTIFSGSKNHCHLWLQPWNKKMLTPWKKSYDQPRQHIKSRDITLPTKVHLVEAMVFPVVMYGCESWTIKRAEHQRTDAFELWCWRRLLRVSWTARTSNQSILKEISPGCSLEGLTVSWNSITLATWCKELTHLKRPWCWERLKAGED